MTVLEQLIALSDCIDPSSGEVFDAAQFYGDPDAYEAICKLARYVNVRVRLPADRVDIDFDDPLFARLREWRNERAKADKAKAYYIFSNKTLWDIASQKPQSSEQLLSIGGVGAVKLEKYGDEVLAVLRDYNERA